MGVDEGRVTVGSDGRVRRFARLASVMLLTAACGRGGEPEDAAVTANAGREGNESAAAAVACEPGNGGITLPEGFCAAVVADTIGRARHLVVAPNGDIYVALMNARDVRGGIVALRDTTGDGVADMRARFGENGGTGILLRGDHLYFATDEAVLRYQLTPNALTPSGPPDTIVRDLPSGRSHSAKSIDIARDGALYVNIGSPSNSCQERDRQPAVKGLDPCPELETRAGIWRFDANRLRQTQREGERFATGLRNVVALRLHPRTDVLYGAVHGRDQLLQNWPALYSEQESAENPAEELVRIEGGDDFGWPYCYYSVTHDRKVLAPEYGGDAQRAGRCAEMKDPLIAFPGHFAPNALHFYTGTQFPPRYRGGAFIAFHGSWNRAPLPQRGYKVVFVPADGDAPGTEWSVFADGFAGATKDRGPAERRPTGLAEGPDGSLYISDSQRGRVWRVVYRGGR